MAAQGAKSFDCGCHESVLDDVFECYGPLEVEAFIDLQFENALRGEEELYSSNQGERRVIGSKLEVEVENVEADGPLPTLESFTYGINTQINLDETISLASPQEELESDVACPYCRRAWEKDGLVDCRTFHGDNKVNRKATTPLTSQEKTSGCNGGIEMREETIDPRKCVVTELQLSDISDDVGTCWRVLGPKLRIAAAKIRNLDDEYSQNRDKANALLIMWKEQVGSGALAGHLADALESIGRKSIAEKLLGVSNITLPACTTVSEGHVISLTVKCDLDAELDNKLMLCEDDVGNKYMLKAVSSIGCWKSEEIQKNKTFLETVAVAAQAMGKTAEQTRQESLKRISSEVQELRQKLKRVKLDCGDADLDTSDGVKSCPQGDVQSRKETLGDVHVSSVCEHSSQGESVQQLLKSCEDQRIFCEGIYGALIKLIGEVGQPREDNAKCIRQLCDFTKELQDQEETFFSKIEQVRSQSQHLDKVQVAEVEKLDKWRRVQKQQVEGVEKLLSSLLSQGMMERRESHGKMEKSQKLLNRRSEPIKSTPPSGFGRRRTKTETSKNCGKSQNEISSPVCVHRMCAIDTNKKLKKEKQKDSP